jgi:hypothetical protein
MSTLRVCMVRYTGFTLAQCTHRAHDKGVPAKVVAWLMGHTNADVTINVSTQVLDASLRTAVDRIGR